MSITRLARRKGFQSLLGYEASDWTADRDSAEFGACFTPAGNARNYDLEVYFEGAIDPATGMIANLQDIDALLGELLSSIDGKNLREALPEFRERAPTTEMLANYLSARLLKLNKMKGVRISKLRLYEYEDLWVDVWP